MKKSKQISESLPLGIVLALAGGFMDAYSYICRGGVFANAQTGNILLIGVDLSKGMWHEAFTHAAPVAAFSIGIALSDIVRVHMRKEGLTDLAAVKTSDIYQNREKNAILKRNMIHWRQVTVLFEAFVLFVVSFLSQDMNLLANSLISFACGIQVESFRKINGNGIATTMCIGNLRTATQAVCEYHYTKDKAAFERGVLFYGIIIFFVIGAIIGNYCVEIWQEMAIRVCSVLLIIGFFMMFIDEEFIRLFVSEHNK